ncbi:MAG: dTDP-4-dehydrorhamnose reductase [Balneolaceae bacterium]|nr:dTDP-4-dehydrorhamnose reductase [Balneolaceae bacterium]
MEILLTGSNGQLGKEWQRYLRESNKPYSAFNSKEFDITDKDKIKVILEKEDPDVFINCAAYTAVDQAEEQREQANLVNHRAVQNLAIACKERGIKFVHFSTDYVFPGKASDKDQFPKGYHEDSKPAPINYYGLTKWKGEEAIRESGCDYLIIRVSWLCGQYGKNFLKTMLRLARDRDKIKVVGDQWGSPTFAADVVRNTHVLLEKGFSGTYHITSRGITSWADFARFIFECADKNIDVQAIPTSEYPTKAERPKFSKLNTQKIESLDEIELLHWKEGTKDLTEQLKNN